MLRDQPSFAKPAIAMMQSCSVVFGFFLFYTIINGNLASAQTLTPIGWTGNPSNSSADLHGADSINTQSLSLKIDVPLLSLQERGRTYTWKYVYNTPTYQISFVPYLTPPPPNCDDCATGNWEVFPPNSGYTLTGPANWALVTPTSWYLAFDAIDLTTGIAGPTQCISSYDDDQGTPDYEIRSYTPDNNFRLVDPEGTQHPLGMYLQNYVSTYVTGNPPPNAKSCQLLPNLLTSPTLDGSGAFVDLTQNAFWLKDGTKYTMTASPGANVLPHVIQVEDSNGNLLTSDMMNRIGLKLVQPGTNPELYQYMDSNGVLQTITITLEQVSYSTDECPLIADSQLNNPCSESSGTYTMPQSIVLPNGSSYQFQYNQGGHGELTSMTLPTGAVISYTYQRQVNGVANSRGGGESFHYAVQRRTETVGGTANQWTYSYGGLPGLNYGATTVQDPLGNCVQHTYAPVTAGFGTSETSVVYESGCGSSATTLRTVATSYGYDLAIYPGLPIGAYNIRPTTVTTTLANGQSSQVQTSFDSFTFGSGSYPGSWMDPLEIREYDFGASTPTRITDFTYLYTTGSTKQPASQYVANHLVSKVSTKTVSSSSGPIIKTSYDYDNYGAGITSSGVAVDRDSTYGNWGNVTTQTVTDSTTGTAYKTSYGYEDTGNVVSVLDPRSNLTTFSYADSWTNTACALSTGSGNIYLTKVINAANQSTSLAYDSCSGAASAVTDVNGQVTGELYDLMGRTEKLTYPDGGQKSWSYVDAIPNQMTANVLINASTTSSSTTTFDGLGRPVQTQLADPYGPDLVTTTYDGDGRVSSVSNPYRSVTDPTYGTTKYIYDALGRKISQTQADNTSVLWWCYDGVSVVAGQKNCSANVSSLANATWVDSTDELGNHWQRASDGLGRLRTVMEPDPALGTLAMETDYSYDVLDNLLAARQNGEGTDTPRNRTFTYDAFSRLLCAANPESSSSSCPASEGTAIPSGVFSYSYDPDGNVSARTNPGGVKTNYSYDVLNRLLSKTYPNDPAGTPSSCYQYDGARSSNLVGRLTNAWTQSASVGVCAASAPSSGFIRKRSILLYDPLGRLLNEAQYTLASVASGTPYKPSYTYDLAGDLLTSTDGTTPSPTTPGTTLTFTNTYDSAAHLTAVTSNWSDATHPSTLFSLPTSPSIPCANSSTLSYTASGVLQNATYGSGITLNRAYDVRLRKTCEIDQ